MVRVTIPTALAITCLFATVVVSAEVRISFIETQDPYTKVLGLSEFLAAEKVISENLSEEFSRGALPDLSNVDLVIFGSYITTDPRLAKSYHEVGATLRRFVADGGVVAVLGQADQDLADETWMEPQRRIRRADPDAGTAFITRPGHPLLTAHEPVRAADLRNWRVPSDWRSPNTIWEAFSEWNEAAVILGSSDDAAPATAGLIETGWGSGRAVFYAMAPDKAFAVGNDAAKAGGAKLLRNLLAYAALVREGKAPDVEITPTPGYKHPIRGVAFVDENGNGRRESAEPDRAGIAVSDGLDVVLTDETGAYLLPNEDGKAVFVVVHQPGNVKQSGQNFFHRLKDDAGPEQEFDFGLVPDLDGGRSSKEGVRFVQLTDSHVRNVSDRDYMRQATDEIYAMQPPPDFVVATGDLVDWGVDEHFQNYVAGMQKPPVPHFNVFGNHELVYSSIAKYHYFIGPDYYSFERDGVLFLALNCVIPSARQEAWLTRTLELLGRDRPVVVFQHFPPVPEELERFAKLGVKSVFSGHWHSEKEMEHAGVQSINSPTFIMGGIDASPAGFKVVHLSTDGLADTEWRYGFQKKLLTVVSPQEGTPVSETYFPVLVNAYDSSTDVAAVEWRVGPEEKPLASGSLKHQSAISWNGLQDVKLAKGSYPLHIVAKDGRGETWTVDQQVETLPGEAAVPAPSREWPMFMGDAGHSGFTPGLVGQVPLRLAWSVATGGDPDFASPILAEGRLYLTLKKRTRGRTNGVAAFDPVTGKRLWLFETPMAINHTPAFSEGVLCAAEMGGRIYGVDAATGHERWHHDLIDDRGRYSYCAPAAHDGSFYAGVLRRVAKLRPRDGHVGWEQQLGASDSDWISSYGSPAVGGETLVMTGQFGRGDSVVAAATANGSKSWGHPADGGMLGSATIAGDRVLFCSHSSVLYCLSLSDGKERWSRPLGAQDQGPNWSATTPAVKLEGETGIVVAGSGDGRMSGINLRDGTVLWTHISDPTVFKVSPYRRDDRPLLSSPTIAGANVFFGSADGRLYQPVEVFKMPRDASES